jgi:ABC-type sugar transport system substrate-binding protein
VSTQISAVKVFSTTMGRDREAMGERISAWLQAHPELTPVDVVVTQSSDVGFHCLSITISFEGDATKYLGAAPAPAPKAEFQAPPRPVVPRPLR